MADENQKYLGADIIPAIKAKVEEKQDKLVGTGEGQNIKTINGESVLGAGDIEFPTAKLYGAYGTNEDGALTQKFASEKLQALETTTSGLSTNVETLTESVEGNTTNINTLTTNLAAEVKAREDADTAINDTLDEHEGDINALLEYSEKTVQTNTKLAETNTSTVTLIKTTGAINSNSTTDTELPLPVASETQAGVLNPTIYTTIQNNAAQISAILEGSVLIEGLAADVTQEQLTAAWKTETGLDDIINGAKIYDKANGKVWTYYSNVSEWESADVVNPELEISQFTNTQAGTIKGSATGDGKIYAESDGTGSVLGWDVVKTSIANNTTAISTINTTLEGLGDTYALKTDLEKAQSDIDDNAADIAALQADKQDKLVGTGEGQNIKTVNGQTILGTGDIEIDVPEPMTAEEFETAWNAA